MDEDKQRLNELFTAIRLTQAFLNHCTVPEFMELHKAAIINYTKQYEELKKKLDKIKQ